LASAERILKTILKLNPNDARTLQNLSQLKENAGNKVSAQVSAPSAVISPYSFADLSLSMDLNSIHKAMADTLMKKACLINKKESRFTSCGSGGYDDSKENPALRTAFIGPNGLPIGRDAPKDMREAYEEAAKKMGMPIQTIDCMIHRWRPNYMLRQWAGV
jgi:hypothetical protein